MEKELLLYRNINEVKTPFPNEKDLLHNNNVSLENPIIVENPSPDGIEEVKVTDIYCDLVAGREYEFTAEASLPFAKSLDDGVEYYLFKDKSSSVRIGITHLGRVNRTDSKPEMYFDRIVEGNKVTARFTPLVSGRYYIRCDNNQDNSIAEYYNFSIVEKAYSAQVSLTTFTYNAQRMAATPTITASFNYPRCLDDDWGVDVYAEYKGEKYYIRQIPSSSKDNKSVMYKHDITLYSERFVLENIYLYDVLKNDDTNVIIRCNLKDFTDVINRSLEKSKLLYRVSIDDSVANTEKALEVKDIALDKVYLSVALQEIYNQWGIAYYFEGYNIIVKDYSVHIYDNVLEYGYDKSLLSIKKDNANFRKITRCSGYGSDKNIPFFYPNLSQKGVIDLEPLESNKLLQKSDFVITDMRKFDKQMPLNGNVTYQTKDSNKPNIVGNIGSFEHSNTKINKQFNIPFILNTDRKNTYINVDLTITTEEAFYIPVFQDVTWEVDWQNLIPKELSPNLKVVFSVASSGGSIYIQDNPPIENTFDHIQHIFYLSDNRLYYKIKRTINVKLAGFLSETDIFTSKDRIYNCNILYYLEDSEYVKNKTVLAKGKSGWKMLAHTADYKAKLTSEGIVNYYYNGDINLDTGWYLNKTKKINLSDIGVQCLKSENNTMTGEGFKQVFVSKIPVATNLMPPLYRESLGNEKFYNAKDNTYLNDNNEYYDFETEWTEVNQNEHIQPFEEIYPTITNIVNVDKIPFDEILDVAFDDNDNNEVDEEGNFLHPYFYVKIAQFNGSNGFNLFDHKIVGGNMQVSFTSGACSACVFDIMVKTRPNVNNETYEDVINPIKTENGVLVDGDWQQKTAGNFGSEDTTQQNSETNSIWLVLKKDDQTFGTTLPDSIGNVIPKKGDKFVLLNIEMPQQYIENAEELLRQNIIQYMWENNSDKWNFTIDFSRIFLQENPTFVNDLSENAKVRVKYNDVIYDFYVNNFSYEVKANEVLPKIKIGLADTLSVNKSITQTIASGVLKDVQSQLSNVSLPEDLNEQYLRKRYDETMPNNMVFEKNINVNGNLTTNYISSNNYNGKDNFNIGFKLETDEKNNSTLVVDNAIIRKKLKTFELIVNQFKAQGGTLFVTPASMECVSVETHDTYYRCFLDTQKTDTYNEFAENDLAICQRFGSSSKRYWRKVVGLGQNYIDLSIEECEPSSDAPEEGDTIIQLGNTTNIERQSAIEISSVGDNSPSFTMYSGIDSFSLVGKEITGIEYKPDTYQEDENGEIVKVADGYPNFFSYGSMYFGSRDKNSNYILYQKNEQGNFEMVINAKTTFKSGTQNISDILASIDNTANTAKSTADTANSTANTAKSNATKAQNTANETKEKLENLDASVKPITDAIKGSTEIEGGLVTTNIVMVKDSNNVISGGISGQSSNNITFWSGGTYQDAINGNCNVIIRKDGTAKIGSFVIENNTASIQLSDGNVATMSADGIEVTLANGGKATYNSSGVSIINSANEEKIKLINGDVSIGNFRTIYERTYSYIDSIDRPTMSSAAGESYPITSNNGYLSWTTTISKNTRTLKLNCSTLNFKVLYSSTKSSGYVDYFNVQIVLLNSNNGVISTFKKFAIKVICLSSNTYTNNYHQAIEDVEVDGSNFASLDFGSSNTNNYVRLNTDDISINNVVDNASLGTRRLGVLVKRFGVQNGNITSGVASSTYNITWNGASVNIKLEEYTPKTLIGTNGFLNFNSSNKFFGAYMSSDNKYHIEGRADIFDIKQN